MKVIGLTGGTGSGKSVVSDFLKQKGAYIIDADQIAHDIIQKGTSAYQEIIQYFGSSILNQKEEIVRKKLGSIVFANQEKLDFLNRCTHKYIVEEIDRQIQKQQQNKNNICIVLDAPLLFEANLESRCHEIWVVFAQEEIRAKRIMQRDSITYQDAKKRIYSQKSWCFYKKNADFILDNSKDFCYLKQQLETAFFKRILEKNEEKL